MNALRIKEVRKANGLDRQSVANIAEIKLRTYISYEDGERLPPLPIAKRIADVLGCTVDDLLGKRDAI